MLIIISPAGFEKFFEETVIDILIAGRVAASSNM